jgi:hypothetical protein
MTRRKEEKIMTIEEIHQEIANEEAAARRVSRLRRSSSSDLKSLSVSADGFRKVPITSRSISSGALLTRSNSSVSNTTTATPTLSHPVGVRRVQSMTVVGEAAASKSNVPKLDTIMSPPTETISKNTLSIRDLELKASKILKEYTIIGDLEDSLESIQELLDSTSSTDVEMKTAKLVEAFFLWVLEQKQETVDKLLTLLRVAHQRKIVTTNAFLQGLKDPLEFLSDIEIDAPLARTFLQTIVSALGEMTNDPNSFQDAKRQLGI